MDSAHTHTKAAAHVGTSQAAQHACSLAILGVLGVRLHARFAAVAATRLCPLAQRTCATRVRFRLLITLDLPTLGRPTCGGRVPNRCR